MSKNALIIYNLLTYYLTAKTRYSKNRKLKFITFTLDTYIIIIIVFMTKVFIMFKYFLIVLHFNVKMILKNNHFPTHLIN